MANRGQHYEKAFEAYLRSLRIGNLSVDESRRAFPEEGVEETIKNLDFVITPASGRILLVDVKGRRLDPGRKTLENWATVDDVESLGRWQRVFGDRAEALLVFVYHLLSDEDSARFEDSFDHVDRHYGCLAISVHDYRRHMRVRSQSWKTVSIPKADFERLARPVSAWLSDQDTETTE